MAQSKSKQRKPRKKLSNETIFEIVEKNGKYAIEYEIGGTTIRVAGQTINGTSKLFSKTFKDIYQLSRIVTIKKSYS